MNKLVTKFCLCCVMSGVAMSCATDEVDLVASDGAPIVEEVAQPTPEAGEEAAPLSRRSPALPSTPGEIEPAHASCGVAGPNRDGRRIADAASPNSANQRSGSSTSCTAPGALQPSDDAIYYCWTVGSDQALWTYLQNVRTGVRGWVRNSLLRIVGGARGANAACGFGEPPSCLQLQGERHSGTATDGVASPIPCV